MGTKREIVEELDTMDGFERVRLADVADVVRGVTYKKDDATEKPTKGLIPILRANNIQDGTLELDGDLVYVPRDLVSDEQVLRKGDIVIATSSGSKDLVGKAAPMREDWHGSFGAFCAVVRPRKEIHPLYLVHFLGSPEYKDLIRDKALGVNINNLRRGDLEDLQIPLAPLPEQRRIVSAIETQLGRLDAAAARLHVAKAKLKRYKQAVLKAAVEGELVELEVRLSRGSKFEHASELLKIKDDNSEGQKRRAGRMWGSGHVPVLTDEERDRLPEGWAWTKVRALGYSPEDAVQVGPMSMKSEDFRDDGTPVLNVGCVKWGEFDETKLNYLPEAKAREFERYRIKPGDVLFTRSGTVGRCAVAQAHQDGWLMTFHLLRARTNPKKCLPDYLRTVFEGAPHILRQTKDASIGSTRAGFNTNLLAELDVPLPPMREQVRIVAAVEQSMERIRDIDTTLDAQLMQSTRLRQAVLKRAFEGRLV